MIALNFNPLYLFTFIYWFKYTDMSQGSKQMQKTIPRSPQEEIEIQTDLKYYIFYLVW